MGRFCCSLAVRPTITRPSCFDRDPILDAAKTRPFRSVCQYVVCTFTIVFGTFWTIGRQMRFLLGSDVVLLFQKKRIPYRTRFAARPQDGGSPGTLRKQGRLKAKIRADSVETCRRNNTSPKPFFNTDRNPFCMSFTIRTFSKTTVRVEFPREKIFSNKVRNGNDVAVIINKNVLYEHVREDTEIYPSQSYA